MFPWSVQITTVELVQASHEGPIDPSVMDFKGDLERHNDSQWSNEPPPPLRIKQSLVAERRTSSIPGCASNASCTSSVAESVAVPRPLPRGIVSSM